jgi:glyoxylase-like metal-dependent hydrolase (beta-lactamase superfamily II)
MPHGTVRLGGVELTCLCDLATRFPRPLTEAFPDIPRERWPELLDRYPDTRDGEDGWFFHVHTYVLQTPAMTVLVDTGVGPSTTVAAQWIGTAGRLPEELREAGLSPADVDVVVITHLHLDHIGWAIGEAPGGPEPAFPNARYLIHRTDWEGFRELGDEDDREAFDRQVTPLGALGVVDLIEGEHALEKGLMVVPTPGHTPGHQSVLVQSDEGSALVSGDLTNHPAQATDPRWRSSGDMDPALAAWIRRRWLDRVEADGALLCTAHYPEPFGVLVREGQGRFFAPRT